MWIEVCDVEDNHGYCCVDFSTMSDREKQMLIKAIDENRSYQFNDVLVRTGCVEVEVELHE